MPDEEMKKFLSDVVGVCEATSCEHQNLWERWHGEADWQSNAMGLGETVGRLADMPVCISLQTAVINGGKILFWRATSQVVDHRMIDKWLNDTLPTSAFRDNDPRRGVNETDATNFHTVMPRKW